MKILSSASSFFVQKKKILFFSLKWVNLVACEMEEGYSETVT